VQPVDTESTHIDGRTVRFQNRRPDLLDGAAEYVLDNGLAELSLRRVAEALGVTHATLLRHFSSKDELVLAVIEQIRSDFVRQLSGEIEHAPGGSVAALAKTVWARLCQPLEQRQFRLLFELVSRRYAGDSAFVESMIRSWVELIADRILGAGDRSGPEAAALATLMLALFRGLQLDLMLTGDRERVEAALDASLIVFERH
jgi:AcrR family transcriptional regulator